MIDQKRAGLSFGILGALVHLVWAILHASGVAQQLSDWNAQPETKFTTLIVQPFVLVAQSD